MDPDESTPSCPDCGKEWDGRFFCPHCGLTEEDLEAAAAFLEELVEQR